MTRLAGEEVFSLGSLALVCLFLCTAAYGRAANGPSVPPREVSRTRRARIVQAHILATLGIWLALFFIAVTISTLAHAHRQTDALSERSFPIRINDWVNHVFGGGMRPEHALALWVIVLSVAGVLVKQLPCLTVHLARVHPADSFAAFVAGGAMAVATMSDNLRVVLMFTSLLWFLALPTCMLVRGMVTAVWDGLLRTWRPNDRVWDCPACLLAVRQDAADCPACQSRYHKECLDVFGGCTSAACSKKSTEQT